MSSEAVRVPVMDTPIVVLVLSAILLEFVGFVGIASGRMGVWTAVSLWTVALGLLVTARLVEHLAESGPRRGQPGRGV
ncbi:hypothetical protein [Halomarina litorea]|uniref:hypothetical protein n=1 Tax=Halomarina litorea TaxID=2961595 RepID=UPI0020C4643C|nr:hypothetical protein [Halomarina sp. BCD28]